MNALKQHWDIQVDRRVVDFMRTAKDNDFLE
jgi:hypothetical protein